MNHFLKLAYDHGAQQALADLEKLAAFPGPGFLHRLGLPGLGHMPFLPKGAFTNFADDFAQGGLTGMGYGGDLGLAAAASMGAFNAVDD